MKKHLLVCLIGLLSIVGVYGNSGRTIYPLDKGWGIKPITEVKKDVELKPVTIPHTWNAEYIEGTSAYNRELMIYKRKLQVTPEMKGKRLFLFFEGVNSVADVFVNFQTVAHHLGGYTAFCTEITNFVKEGDNELEVWASNAYRTDVLPISGDFNVYGGIHRPCYLIVTEPDCISPLFYASSGVLVHQRNISNQKAEIEIETILSLSNKREGLNLHASIYDANGKCVASVQSAVKEEHTFQSVTVENPVLWHGRQNPYLYTIKVELYDGDRLLDEVTEQTGFRYFAVDAEKGFMLNGKPYELYGFCRHEDVPGKGSALLPEDYEKDMALVKEIGATGIRLTHYPHAKRMHQLCDRDGIVVWAEIPLCGPGGYNYTGYVKNEGLQAHSRQVLNELVYQNYNHPSICFWGIFNELLITDNQKFQAYDHPVAFVKELNEQYKRLDPTRLTTFATCVDQTHYLGCADLIAWNKYFGWNGGEQIGPFMDKVKADSKGTPVGVSEYGFGGSIKQHLCPVHDEKMKLGRLHPENFQAISHEKNWEALSVRDYLWARFIWVFADFQSTIRKEGDKDGINDKGLVTYDRKRKDVFYFYKTNWNKEPLLHLCDTRYVERKYDTTQVKVYTNLDTDVTLYVNGKKIGKQKRDALNRVVWADVHLQKGENHIQVEAKKGKKLYTETCTWILQ